MSDKEFEFEEEIVEPNGSTKFDKSFDDIVNTYLDDDLDMVKSDDSVIQEDADFALIRQMENVISWEVVGLENEDGERKSKTELKNDPPVLLIKSSDGNQVEFLLTKELSRTFSEVFTNIYRAYFGVSPKRGTKAAEAEKQSFTDKLSNSKEYFLDHPVFSVFLALLLLFMLAGPSLLH